MKKLSVIKEDAIDESFRIVQSPVFVVTRHGWSKRCLSRSAAINNLAHYMTTHAFRVAGVRTHYPDTPVERDGVTIWQAGKETLNYLAAHRRCTRRIRRILAKKREFQQWVKKHEEIKQQYAAHLANKPY